MAEQTKDLAYYRALPYRRRALLIQEDSGEAYFMAEVVELPGVEAEGADPYEAFFHLQQAFDDYIAAMLKWGEAIPEPDARPIPRPRGAKKAVVETRYVVEDAATPTFRLGDHERPEWELADLQPA